VADSNRQQGAINSFYSETQGTEYSRADQK